VRPSTENRLLALACYGAVLAVVIWGALSFGAVYPWAYQILSAASFVAGLLGLVVGRRNRPPILLLSAALILLAAATGVQLIPFSRETLQKISPATVHFLAQYDFSYVVTDAAHPISIAPIKTYLGLLLLIAFATFMLGVTKLVSRFGVQRLAVGLITFGALLAIFGIVQEVVNLSNHYVLVYGFWKPQYLGSRPFGPFINRNHFAGWMLMALPLALGYVYASIERIWQLGPSGVHNRISILATGIGGRLILLIFGCATMFMSALMTRSRSGIAAVGVGALLAGAMVILKQTDTRRRVTTAALFVVIVGATAAWAGSETILERALGENANTGSVGGRIPIWRDTLTIIRDFPLFGSGLDTYGTATMVYQTAIKELHFQEAHNDYLQLAAEGGLLLGIPILLTVAIFVREVRRRFKEAPKEGMTYWLRVGAVIGMISIAAQAVVEFSLQMPGNAAMFALLAAIALHQSPNLRDRPASP
jgi:O-antigen ligase/polysaccharide polymerase Wzy-like membrane protein